MELVVQCKLNNQFLFFFTKKGVKILLNTKESRTTLETKRTTELYPGPQVEPAAEINQGEASYDQ